MTIVFLLLLVYRDLLPLLGLVLLDGRRRLDEAVPDLAGAAADRILNKNLVNVGGN